MKVLALYSFCEASFQAVRKVRPQPAIPLPGNEIPQHSLLTLSVLSFDRRYDFCPLEPALATGPVHILEMHLCQQVFMTPWKSFHPGIKLM